LVFGSKGFWPSGSEKTYWWLGGRRLTNGIPAKHAGKKQSFQLIFIQETLFSNKSDVSSTLILINFKFTYSDGGEEIWHFCFPLHPLNKKSVISWTSLTSIFLGDFQYAFEFLLSFRSMLLVLQLYHHFRRPTEKAKHGLLAQIKML